jgi:hypothetical protein
LAFFLKEKGFEFDLLDFRLKGFDEKVEEKPLSKVKVGLTEHLLTGSAKIPSII